MIDRQRISCICVTKNRPLLLREAISCFLDQDYPDKELIVLIEEDDPGRKVIEGENVIMLVIPNVNMSLGELRNYAIEHASGEYIAQWDDDDWSHPQRLSHQFEELNGFEGILLNRITILDKARDQRYVSHHYPWEGSILVTKSAILKHPYPALKKGEDTPAVQALLRAGLLRLLDRPELYVYVYHGENTWDSEHFENIFRCCTRL